MTDDKTTTSSDFAALRAPMQAVHDSGDNLTLAWRRTQLSKLREMLLEFWDDFLEALQVDLGKDSVEAAVSDCFLVKEEVDNALRWVRRWMQSEKVTAPMVMLPSFHRIEKRPLLGPACLVIGPSNYPLNLCLIPIVGALAAGNPVVLKPSELTPHTSALLERAVHKHFEPGVLRVVNGGAPVASALIQLSWGKIFFTGSEGVGRIVATAAAQTLTPVVLELGGKCPVIVDETAPMDLQVVANRIAWAKMFNTGQTCVAADYVLVHESKRGALLECLIRTVQWQYGDNPRQSELGRIVTQAHAERLQEMIREVQDDPDTRVLVGRAEDCDPAVRYVCPTIIDNPPVTARLWKEEIFGPLLPIQSFQTRQEAMNKVQNMPGTPLAMYVFTRHEKVLQEYMQNIRAGAVFRNDCLVHGSSTTLPFGGLGSSGMGNYHGRFSFDTFSQALPVSFRPAWAGSDFGMARYHPYKGAKGWFLLNVLMSLPYVPVLHCRKVLAALVFVALGVWVWPTPVGVRALVDYLRSVADDTSSNAPDL